MAYLGLVSSEHSSGETTKRGGITKTGNGHVRRVLIEAARAYRFSARINSRARKATSSFNILYRYFVTHTK
jgi:transposase